MVPRRKLFKSSPEPNTDSGESDTEYESSLSHSPLFYFNEDPELPVYSQTPSGYSLPHLVDILMSGSVSQEVVCKVQPLGVSKNRTFLIDLDSVSIDDLRADDLGSWKSTGTRRSYFEITKAKLPEFLPGAPSGDSHFVIIRRYFIHQTYHKFHRCIVEIQGKMCILCTSVCGCGCG